MAVSTNDKILNALSIYHTQLMRLLNQTFVAKVEGKNLSSNDFTNELKTKLENLDTSKFVEKIESKTLSSNDFTDAYKAQLDSLESDYAKKSDVASVLKYRGTVQSFAALPTNAEIGDVYNITESGNLDMNGVPIQAGDNVAYTGSGWDVLAGAVDLTNYVEKIEGKNLSSNDFTDSLKSKLESIDTDTFVVKVAGKDLSSNDFTDSDKTKLNNLENISTETFVTKVEGKILSSNDFTNELKTKLEGLENISTETFVTKVEGKTLSSNDFTDADKTKLDSLVGITIGGTEPTDGSIWIDTSGN